MSFSIIMPKLKTKIRDSIKFGSCNQSMKTTTYEFIAWGKSLKVDTILWTWLQIVKRLKLEATHWLEDNVIIMCICYMGFKMSEYIIVSLIEKPSKKPWKNYEKSIKNNGYGGRSELAKITLEFTVFWGKIWNQTSINWYIKVYVCESRYIVEFPCSIQPKKSMDWYV